MEDNYILNEKRRILVEGIKAKGIKNSTVLDAIANVPRDMLLDKNLKKYAYQDRALPIAAGQTISQPYTVAFQSQLLEVKKGDKVLEVGTGSGYQAAVLCEMGLNVYTIERQKELYLCSGVFLRNATIAFIENLGMDMKGFQNMHIMMGLSLQQELLLSQKHF